MRSVLLGAFYLALVLMPTACDAQPQRVRLTSAPSSVLSENQLEPVAKFIDPPQKVLDFAARNPEFMRRIKEQQWNGPLIMSDTVRLMFDQVNAEGNAKIKWTDDRTSWGQEENWDFPCEKDGQLYDDCDGIALWKYRRLVELGLPAGPLFITQGVNEKGEGHAVLVVRTTEGDFILDNRFPQVMRFSELKSLGYNLLFRPASGDKFAGRWVEMRPSHPIKSGQVAPDGKIFGPPLCTPRQTVTSSAKP